VVHKPCDLPVKFPTKLELVVNNMATEHIAADDPVYDVVERLLHVSGQWVVAAAVDRDETKRRMLETSNVSLSYLHHDDTNGGAVAAAVRI
jgi:hypothetical protein